MVSQNVLKALRQALTQDREIPLVTIGKGRADKGLFAKATGASREAIDTCLNEGDPLLTVVREVTSDDGVRKFVEINDRGIRILSASVSVDEIENLLSDAAPRFRGKLITECLASLRHQSEVAIEERRHAIESQEHIATAAINFTKAYLNDIDQERERLELSQAKVRADLDSISAIANRRHLKPIDSKDVVSTEADLDFQRDVAEELVFAWQDAHNRDAKSALERVMFNIGISAVGQAGEKLEFDGRWQQATDEVLPRQTVVIIEQGWRLVNARGDYLIARAKVARTQSP